MPANNILPEGDEFWLLHQNSNSSGQLMLNSYLFKSPNYDGEVFLKPNWTLPADGTQAVFRIINGETWSYDFTIANEQTPQIFPGGDFSYVPALYPDGQYRGPVKAFNGPGSFVRSMIRSQEATRNFGVEYIWEGSWTDGYMKFRMPPWPQGATSVNDVLYAATGEVGFWYGAQKGQQQMSTVVKREWSATEPLGNTSIVGPKGGTFEIPVPANRTNLTATDHTVRIRGEIISVTSAGPDEIGRYSAYGTVEYHLYWDTYLIDTWQEDTITEYGLTQPEMLRMVAPLAIANRWGCATLDGVQNPAFYWGGSILEMGYEGSLVHNNVKQPLP